MTDCHIWTAPRGTSTDDDGDVKRGHICTKDRMGMGWSEVDLSKDTKHGVGFVECRLY